MSETPLSCPFCGGEAELVEAESGMFETGYAVYCAGKCQAKLGVSGRLGEPYEWTPVFDTEADAIAVWNARTAVTDEQFARAVHDGNWWGRCSDYEERRGYYEDAETIRNQQEHIARLERRLRKLGIEVC